MPAGKKISVDQDVCIGCGACAASLPEYFELSEKTGKSSVKKSFDPKDEDKIKKVMSNCPVHAIELE